MIEWCCIFLNFVDVCVLSSSVVAVDLHCGQIQGFFGPRTPCDNLEAHVVVLPFFRDMVSAHTA